MNQELQKLRLCFVGPMVGRHPGYVFSYGEKLARDFEGAGYSVLLVSTSPNRYIRPLDIALKLHRWRNKIDLVLIDVYSGWSFLVSDLASWLARYFRLPLVVVLHGGALPKHFLRFPDWTKRVLTRADQIVVPSHYLGRAAEMLNLNARIIPNLLNLADYRYNHRQKIKPKLLWMRTFHPLRNPEMAIRVLARLKPDYPDITLCMAGQDTGSLGQVKDLAQELGLTDAVRFPGFLDSKGKITEAGNADIFINTNRVDNMPVSVLEACASGLPVVSTAVGGISDLLKDGETALLVSDDDDEAMANAIRRLLEEPELTSRLCGNGRRLAESLSWEIIRKQWEELFAKFLPSKIPNAVPI